jgi:hypothetical protein
MCDRQRALIKRAAKEYTIEEFWQNYADIVRNVAIDACREEDVAKQHAGRFFSENGMYVHDCEVLSISVEDAIEKMLIKHQHDTVRKNLELQSARKEAEIAEAMSVSEKAMQELRSQELINKMELQEAEATRKLEIQAKINRQNEAEKLAAKQAEQDMQVILDALAAADRARKDAHFKQTMEHEALELAQKVNHEKELAEIEKAKNAAYAETVASIMASISPDLIAALEVNGKMGLAETLARHASPYAIANGESVVETTQKLLNGLPFDLKEVIGNLGING